MLTLDARNDLADVVPGRRLRKPRVGFLGVGWIGRHRMAAMAESQLLDIAAMADATPDALRQAQALVPQATPLHSLDALLAEDLDALVIATPSALHAEQAEAALARGFAVFCQKPLARSAAESERVIAAARRADRLLGVDLSYRHTQAMRRIRTLVAAGDLGHVHAVDLVFHNAYGPDKRWFQDPALSREGRDAVVETTFRGRARRACGNVGGSFYDVGAELRRGTTARTIADGPDGWGGLAAVQWARRLAAGERYDLHSRRLVTVAEVIDRIYGR